MRTHRYRNTETGRFLGAGQMVELRDRFLDAQQEAMRELTGRLSEMTVADWARQMRDTIKTTHIDLYVLGHGGRNTMTAQDWGRLGHKLREQYAYLSRFEMEIATGRYTDPETGGLKLDALMARAELYAKSGVSSYERGHALGMGVPDLPDYPGSGSTQCVTNCRCYWSIDEVHDDDGTLVGWNCTWVAVGDAGTCGDCDAHAADWSPLYIARGVGM